MGLTVQEQVYFNGREDFDGQDLKFTVILEVVDEFGNTTEVFTEDKHIKLKCKDCPKSNSTLPTTIGSSSSTAPTKPTTSKTSTTQTIPTTSSTPLTTTTPLPITTPTTPSTPTTTPIPTDCNFNLTDMSGSLQYPIPGKVCKGD